MTIKELKEKVQKAEEAVAKVEKTIERHTIQMEKKLKVVLDHGWNPEDRYCKHGTSEHNDAYWAICEYEDKVNAIKNATEKLEDKKRILKNWKDRLEAAEAKEQKFLTEVPESMKEMMTELIVRWDEYDTERLTHLKEEYKVLGYKEFTKKYPKSYKFMRYETPETIHKVNVKNAEAYVMDLYNRIHLITGEVTDWSGIYCAGVALNGFVKGQLGAVNVETILAGGYNIQRLHCRTLVHVIK